MNMHLTKLVVLGASFFAIGFFVAGLVRQPASAVSVFSSLVVAIATYVLVVEAQRTREAQTAPDVSVSFTQANEAGMVYIIIKNNGAGTARNIKFSVNGDIKTHRGVPLGETSYLQRSIGYLVPDQQIKGFFATNSELMQYINEGKTITILANYENDAGRKYKKEFFNDFSFQEHTIMADLPLEKIGNELVRVRKIVEKLESRNR